jgi:hypothetical protein
MILAAGVGIAAGVAGARLAGEPADSAPERPAPETAANVARPPPVPDAATSSITAPAPPAPPPASPAAVPTAPAAAPTAPAAAPAPAPAPAPAQGSGGPPAPGTAGARSTGGEVVQTGLIIVRSSPWAKVWIDGESLGQTAVRKPVAPGMHRIRLVGPDDRSKDLSRDVRAGETATIRWDW